MKTKTTYVIRFWNSLGIEEYDGGTTIAAARKEAKFFKQHLPGTEIKVCKVEDDRAYLVEVV